jgi:hypothetical protein
MKRSIFPVVVGVMVVAALLVTASIVFSQASPFHQAVVAPIDAKLASLFASAPVAAATQAPAAAQPPAAPAAAATQPPAAPATAAPVVQAPAAVATQPPVKGPVWVEYGTGSKVCPAWEDPAAGTITCTAPDGVSMMIFHSDPGQFKVVRNGGTVAYDQMIAKGFFIVVAVNKGDTVYVTTGFNKTTGHYNVNVVAGRPENATVDEMAAAWALRIQGVAWQNSPDGKAVASKAWAGTTFGDDIAPISFYLQSLDLKNAVQNIAP